MGQGSDSVASTTSVGGRPLLGVIVGPGPLTISGTATLTDAVLNNIVADVTKCVVRRVIRRRRDRERVSRLDLNVADSEFGPIARARAAVMVEPRGITAPVRHYKAHAVSQVPAHVV